MVPPADQAFCRGLLLRPPFLPQQNVFLPASDFGFPLDDELNERDEDVTLPWTTVADPAIDKHRFVNPLDRWERWSRNIPKSTSTILLPFLMAAVQSVLLHLETIDISLVSYRK